MVDRASVRARCGTESPLPCPIAVRSLETEGEHQVVEVSSEPNFGVRATSPLTSAANSGIKKRTMPIVAHVIISGTSDWPAAHTTTVGSKPPGTAKTAAIRASSDDVAARSLR
jgi:hypothetical protein